MGTLELLFRDWVLIIPDYCQHSSCRHYSIRRLSPVLGKRSPAIFQKRRVQCSTLRVPFDARIATLPTLRRGGGRCIAGGGRATSQWC